MIPKEASLTEIRKKLKDLQTAKKAGYNVPDLLVQTFENEIREREGILEVWECSRCGVFAEMSVPVVEFACRCGKVRRTWQASKKASSSP